MNMEITKAVASSNSESMTIEIARYIGSTLESGAMLLLYGDLGTGKTTFTKGLCLGLGVDQSVHVRSPTFTLINEYQGRYPIRHADLYRIEGVDDFETIGLLDSGFEGILIVEWADRYNFDLLENTICVSIQDTTESDRQIEFATCSALMDKLIANVPKELEIVRK